SPAFVLECIDDRAQRSVVRADGAGAIDVTGAAAAARTLREREADRAPGGQRISTAIAERRRQRKNRAPAGVADGTARRTIEEAVAGRARWSENDAQKRVACHAKCRMQNV